MFFTNDDQTHSSRLEVGSPTLAGTHGAAELIDVGEHERQLVFSPSIPGSSLEP